MACIAGEYAAVGDGGVILISSNAATWTQMPSATTNSLLGIAGNSFWPSNGLPRFVAVGVSGTAVSSADSITWISQNTGNTNNLRAIIYSADSYSIVGDNGTVLQYATSWSNRNRLGATNYVQAITYGNNKFVLGGSTRIYTLEFGYPYLTYAAATVIDSASLFSFSIATPDSYFGGGDGNQAFTVSGLAFGNGIYVGVGYAAFMLEYDNPGTVMTSSDGMNWNGLPSDTSENSLYGITYANGLFVAVGDAGAIIVSANGTNWTEITGYHRSVITAITCNTNLCVASASGMGSGFADFNTLVSTNGVNWSAATANTPAMVGLAGGGAQIVGVNGNALYTTTDGYNWQINSSSSNSFRGVDYVNGQFIGGGDNGSIFTSLDGTNWNDHSISTTGAFYSAAFGNGLYVAAGSVTATSSDGISWLPALTNLQAIITRIAYGNGQFAACANFSSESQWYYNPSGEILTSRDGNNWQVQFTSAAPMTGIAYSGGTFLAISGWGTMFASANGTNWLATGSSLPLVDDGDFLIYYNLNYLDIPDRFSVVCANQETFFAAGLDGILVQSGNTWNPATITPAPSTANEFEFSYSQQIDVPYHIQKSTNLLTWQNVYNGVGSGQPTNFIFSTSVNYPELFFRIVSP